MSKYFCPNCEQEVETKVIEKEETFEIQGINVTCVSNVRICKKCNTEIYDAELDNKNLQRFLEKAIQEMVNTVRNKRGKQ